VDANWQTSDAFDEQFAEQSAQALYQAAQNNSQAGYDFQIALANLQRQHAQQTADTTYQSAQNQADSDYQAAIQQAQNAFSALLAILPPADRANDSLASFTWPPAPNGNAPVVPPDGTQRQPPAVPTYDGPKLDYTRDAAYRAAIADQEKVYSQ